MPRKLPTTSPHFKDGTWYKINFSQAKGLHTGMKPAQILAQRAFVRCDLNPSADGVTHPPQPIELRLMEFPQLFGEDINKYTFSFHLCFFCIITMHFFFNETCSRKLPSTYPHFKDGTRYKLYFAEAKALHTWLNPSIIVSQRACLW